MLLLIDPKPFFDGGPNEIELDELFRILGDRQVTIPKIEPYWGRFLQDCLEPCRVRARGSRARQALRRLAREARTLGASTKPDGFDPDSTMGFFDSLPRDWPSILVEALARCASTRAEISLFTRLEEGRNARVHSGPGECCLVEKCVWRLELIRRDGSSALVPLVRGPRNLALPWTQRYDERLPAESDGATFPFCPIPDWRDPESPVFRTRESRPCWRDASLRYWADPATPGGYHWDVYLPSGQHESFGLGQLNITRFGAPEGEGRPGDLHHVPTGKKPRRKKTTGWTCS